MKYPAHKPARWGRKLLSALMTGVLVLAFLGLPFRVRAAAGINPQINFQGKLVNANGTNAPDGTQYELVFKLYSVDSGGTALWTETRSNMTIISGFFQVYLGSVTSLSGVDFNSDSLYLGIQVTKNATGVTTADAEMTPRVRFSAVPYAFNAQSVNGLTVTNNGGNTLNIAAGKTLAVSNSLTLAGTDSTSFTFPGTTGGTVITSNQSSQTIATTQQSGTMFSFGAPGAVSLNGAMTGLSVNLSTNYTASVGNSITGLVVTLPAYASYGAADNEGVEVIANNITLSTAATGYFDGFQVTMPPTVITSNNSANLTVNGLSITTPTTSTQTQGTLASNGISIAATGIASGTLTAINISAITAGAGTEHAIRIPKAWDTSLALGSLTANDNTTQGVIRFATSGSTAAVCATGTNQGLVFQDQAGNRIGHFCKDSSAGMEIIANSTLINGTDVAENYSDRDNVLEPGDVVAIDPATWKGVRKSTSPYQQDVLGVISTEPGVLLSDISESNGNTDLIHPKPVALSGRIPTKVNTENGPIQVGDYLTSSSVPGVAMKATQIGRTIGRAIEGFSGSGTGTIMVFASTALADPQHSLGNLLASNTTTNSSSAELSLPDVVSLSGLTVADTATISGDLSVHGKGIFSGLVSMLDQVSFWGKSIFHKGVTFNDSTLFKKAPVLPADSAGIAIVKQGTDKISVTFSREYTYPPIINASVTSDEESSHRNILSQGYTYIISDISSTGFTITINKPAVEDLKFLWMAVATDTVPSPTIIQTPTNTPIPVTSVTPVPTVVISPTSVPVDISPLASPSGTPAPEN